MYSYQQVIVVYIDRYGVWGGDVTRLSRVILMIVPLTVQLQYFYFFFLFGLCVRADPAADLAALEDLGLRKTLLAAVAAFFDVTSPFAMSDSFSL